MTIPLLFSQSPPDGPPPPGDSCLGGIESLLSKLEFTDSSSCDTAILSFSQLASVAAIAHPATKTIKIRFIILIYHPMGDHQF